MDSLLLDGRRMLGMQELPTPGIKHLSFLGEIDSYSCHWFTERTKSMLELGNLHFILDMQGVEFMDSHGLLALLRLHREIEALGARLWIVGEDCAVTWLMDITGQTNLFQLRTTNEEAIREALLAANLGG